MSKSDGLKIGIKFTEDLVGNVSPPISVYETQKGSWSASGSYSSSPIYNAKDGSITSYWESRATNYVQIVRPNTTLLGIKVYKGASYRPSNFILRTSSDGNTYTDIKTGNFVATTGWETIMFDEPVTSNYFRINFGYSSILYLYELVLIVEGYDNEIVNDFVITGKEYQHINGSLINKRYKILGYERHPTEPKSVLLTVDWWDKFNNVEGDLTVKYDATKGTLTGNGGIVESFEMEFTPEELIQTPNPNAEEAIKAYPYSITLDFKEIAYHNRYAPETIKAYPYAIVLDLKHVSEVNP